MKRKQIYALLMVMGISLCSPSYAVFASTDTGYTEELNLEERDVVPDINHLIGLSGQKLSDVKLPDGYEWIEPDTLLESTGQQKFKAYFLDPNESDADKVEKELDVYVIPSGLKGKYNQNIEEVKLPAGFTWKDKSDRLSHVGERTYTAIYTPEDLENYKPIEVNIMITIEKADPEEKEYKDKIPTDLFAFPKETLYGLKLPEGFSWQDEDVTFDKLGDFTYKAMYTPSDSENYNVVKNIEIRVKVTDTPQKPTVPELKELTATYGDTLSSVTLPERFSWNSPNTKLETIGENTFYALYVPEDTKHYSTVSVPVKVNVKKKNMTVTYPETSYKLTYGDTFGKIALPEFWSLERASEKPNAGTYTLKATLTVDQEHYNVSNLRGNVFEISVNVSKAVPGYTIPPAINVKAGTKLTDNMLPAVTIGSYEWDDEVSPKSSGTYYCSFYPNDQDNYKVVKHIGVKVIVQRETTNVKPDSGKDNNKGNTGGNTGNNTGGNTNSSTGGNSGNNSGNHSNNNTGNNNNSGSSNKNNSTNSKNESNKNTTGSNNTTVIKPTPLPSYSTGSNYGGSSTNSTDSGSGVKNIKSDSITVADASTVTKKTTSDKKTKLVRPASSKKSETEESAEETTSTETDNSTTTTATTADSSSSVDETAVPENDATKSSAINNLSDATDQGQVAEDAENAENAESKSADVAVNTDEKKGNKGGLIALLCVLAGAFGGGGYYFFKKNYKSGKDDTTGV